jgi:hypothetical protein
MVGFKSGGIPGTVDEIAFQSQHFSQNRQK